MRITPGGGLVTQTAAQRRHHEKIAYDAYLAQCPSRLLLHQIGDKWVILVMSALRHGPLRYMELSRTIAGISQKMLTQTTRRLERNGLISRTIVAAVPVQVTYELSDLGRSLLAVIEPLKTWAEGNMVSVITAQKRYDQDQ